MKFELEIRNVLGSKRIVLPLLCTYPRSFGRIEAIIDTGAPQTILSARDAIKLRIPFTNLESTNPISGFGRGSVPALIINNFQISVHSAEKERKNFVFPIIVVDVPTLKKFGEDALNQALSLSTLIGIDFLELNGLKLFIDVKNNFAYLEE